MSATDPFRAQCASCMRVILDPTAVKCPACGSDRLVVHVGKQTKAAVPAAVDATSLMAPKKASNPGSPDRDKVRFPKKDQPAAASRSTKSQRTRFDPRPIAETCDVCGAQPGTVCDMAKHRKDPLETRYRKSKAARKAWARKKAADETLESPARPHIMLLAPSVENGQPLALTVYEALLFAEKRGDAGVTRNGPYLVADLSVALALLESLRE